jgi:hypothetical protein
MNGTAIDLKPYNTKVHVTIVIQGCIYVEEADAKLNSAPGHNFTPLPPLFG